jgi:hypothetical protein
MADPDPLTRWTAQLNTHKSIRATVGKEIADRRADILRSEDSDRAK